MIFKKKATLKQHQGTSLVLQGLRVRLAMQSVHRTLIERLRSHTPQLSPCTATKNQSATTKTQHNLSHQLTSF